MVVIDDILNELYTIDNDCWYNNVLEILKLLDFPVSFDYACLWEEFLYVRFEKMRAINANDRKVLYQCKMIAHYQMERKYKKIQVFSILIADDENSRNDTVYEITRLFRKLYGPFTVLIFVNGADIAFSGTSISHNRKSEVIISEWFGFERDIELSEKILEIDFSCFTGRSINMLYSNYIWAISRIYVRYQESKMYLIYGCDNPITYETFVTGQYDDETILTTKIDREETLKINSAYYPNMYGRDYFIDDISIEMEAADFFEDADDIEFEWTMLEMELAEEADEEADDDFFEEDENDDLDEYDEELIGLNPEEMLKYIRGE